MAVTLDEKSLAEAFQGRADIQQAIRMAASSPPYIELFNTISQHVCSVLPSSSEPASKKRRLDEDIAVRSAPLNGTNGHATKAISASADDPVILEVKDISMVIPQRKKYTFCLTASHIYAKLPGSIEPVAGTSFAWADIEYAFCLPVPEKTQKQYNYVLFPKNSNLTPSRPPPGSPPIPDPLVFTIADTAPKAGTIGGTEESAVSAVSDDYKTLFDWALSTRLKAAGRKDFKIIQADPKLFASEIRQSHRPTEKAVHVKAFRGSKDGYLFFLPNGILWAFKKPLLFLPHARISAVSYTSVLQRTFNLSVEIDTSKAGSGEESSEEIEFSMLDQEDYGGIDGYVKRHGLQDKSMAEQRKAKLANVNVVKDEDGNVIGNAEAGELARAEAEAGGGGGGGGAGTIGDLDDEEDEEDYDPGSEGDSEGEGSSSEDDEDDEDGGGVGDAEEDGEGDDDDDDDDDES